LRRGALFAVPGDAALGYRLPLASLPYVTAAPIPSSTRRIRRERAPCPISGLAGEREAPPARRVLSSVYPTHRRNPNTGYVEQVAIEARAHRHHGRGTPRPPCVFIPPVETLEDYLDLIATVERVAEETGCRCGSRAIPRPPTRA
jgi:uncharacterized protein (DUF2126 family)